MKTTSEYKELLRSYYETVARQQGVKRMALFGSVARGEQQPGSDVDVVRLRDQLSDTLFGKEVEKDLIYV